MTCHCDGMDTVAARYARTMEHLEMFVVALGRQGADPHEEPEKGMPPRIEIAVLRMAAQLGTALHADSMKKLNAVWLSLPWKTP